MLELLPAVAVDLALVVVRVFEPSLKSQTPAVPPVRLAVRVDELGEEGPIGPCMSSISLCGRGGRTGDRDPDGEETGEVDAGALDNGAAKPFELPPVPPPELPPPPISSVPDNSEATPTGASFLSDEWPVELVGAV